MSGSEIDQPRGDRHRRALHAFDFLGFAVADRAREDRVGFEYGETFGESRSEQRLRRHHLPHLFGNIRGDDLLMIAGVLDRCEAIKRLVKQPIALSRGASTVLTVTAPVAPATKSSLSLSVNAVFLTASEQARARTIVDLLIALIPTSMISVAMRPNYGDFIEFVRNMHQ